MHGFPASDTLIERNGHVGHGAVLHGCRIGADALVGMNAVVMDGAVIGPRSIVAAAAFVKAGFQCPERSLVMGSPAAVKRELSEEEIRWKQAGTREYQALARRCLEEMRECTPLSQPEQDRKRVSDSTLRHKPQNA